MPTIKNSIIFIAIGAALVLIYIFYIRESPDDVASLVSSSSPTLLPETAAGMPSVTQGFLTLLLSVENIKLNDAIFSDGAFGSLRDSSITLIPDGTEGRPNPFAPLGSDAAAQAVSPTNNTGAATSASITP